MITDSTLSVSNDWLTQFLGVHVCVSGTSQTKKDKLKDLRHTKQPDHTLAFQHCCVITGIWEVYKNEQQTWVWITSLLQEGPETILSLDLLPQEARIIPLKLPWGVSSLSSGQVHRRPGIKASSSEVYKFPGQCQHHPAGCAQQMFQGRSSWHTEPRVVPPA